MRRKPLNQLKLKLITKSKTVCRDPRGLCIKQLLWTVCWFPPFPRLIFFSQGLDGLCVELDHPLNVVPIATSSHSIADAQLKARTPHSDCYLNFVVLGCGTLLLCYLNTAFLWRSPSSPSSFYLSTPTLVPADRREHLLSLLCSPELWATQVKRHFRGK